MKPNAVIKLGEDVIDPLTGFTGTAMTRHTYLHGCNRISVQPKIDVDGRLQPESTFDEPQLRVCSEKPSMGFKK